jgi:hypothetical protein
MALNKNMSKKLREIELKIESIKNKIPQFLLLTTENEKSFSGISNGYQKVEKKVMANSDIEVYIFKLPYELKKTMFALDDVTTSPHVYYPLRRAEMSRLADGCVVIVLAGDDKARAY